MEIDENVFKEESNIFYNNKSIYIIQYPNCDKASVSYGIMNNIMDYNINHYCCTESGSSGSPIMNLLNNKIIGIHKEASMKFKINRGTFIKYPVNEFLNQIKNNENNKINKNNLIISNIKNEL